MSDYSTLKILALILFFATFLGIIVWVFRPKSKEMYNKISRIPLNKEDGVDDCG